MIKDLLPLYGRFALYRNARTILPHPDDRVVKVPSKWHNKPGLMAKDLYGSSDYFYAIPQRNQLLDPVFDIVEGMTLIVPPLDHVKASYR